MTFNFPLFFVLAAGATQSLFMGSCLLNAGHKEVKNQLLAALLIAAGFRLLKSALFIFSDNVSLLVINAGFACHAATPVLLWLYMKSLRNDFAWKRRYLAHLLPGLLILVLAPVLTLNDFWYMGGYSALLYYSLGYLVASACEWVQLFSPSKKSATPHRNLGVHLLLISMGTLLLSYFGNYNLRWFDYQYAPLPFALSIFPLSFLIWTRYLPRKAGKYRGYRVASHQQAELAAHVKYLLEIEKIYLNPNLTQKLLAERLRTSSHALSQVFTLSLHTSFSQLVNKKRIQHAAQMLADPRLVHLKIAAIAFESGFRSLSVFNKTFREAMHTTPQNFRQLSLPD